MQNYQFLVHLQNIFSTKSKIQHNILANILEQLDILVIKADNGATLALYEKKVSALVVIIVEIVVTLHFVTKNIEM